MERNASPPRRPGSPARRAATSRDRHHQQHAGRPGEYRPEEDDMTTSPEPPQPPTPADRAEGTISEDEYLGRDGDDGGAGSGTGGDDPTTETDEDTRFA
jgi:hypothetical protein